MTVSKQNQSKSVIENRKHNPAKKDKVDFDSCPNHPALCLQNLIGNAQVARMLTQRVQDEAEEKPEVGAEGGQISGELAQRIQSQRGNGTPLDQTTLIKMEQTFGTDLSNVRLHTNQEADVLNRRLSARAFTLGNDIFFRRDTDSNDTQLLTHELTHVVQQQTLDSGGPVVVGPAGDSFEREADTVASKILSESHLNSTPADSSIQRWWDEYGVWHDDNESASYDRNASYGPPELYSPQSTQSTVPDIESTTPHTTSYPSEALSPGEIINASANVASVAEAGWPFAEGVMRNSAEEIAREQRNAARLSQVRAVGNSDASAWAAAVDDYDRVAERAAERTARISRVGKFIERAGNIGNGIGVASGVYDMATASMRDDHAGILQGSADMAANALGFGGPVASSFSGGYAAGQLADQGTDLLGDAVAGNRTWDAWARETFLGQDPSENDTYLGDVDHSISGQASRRAVEIDQQISQLWADPDKPAYTQTLGWKLGEWLGI